MTRKDFSYYANRPKQADDCSDHGRIDQLRQYVREGVHRSTNDPTLRDPTREAIDSILGNKPDSQALVLKYGLASFQSDVGGTNNNTLNDGKVPPCHITEDETVIRDKAAQFHRDHKTNHPTLDTAREWQKQLTRVSTLDWRYSVEQGESVQNLCHVDHKKNSPVTTPEGLSELETQVREKESKLSGILFIVRDDIQLVMTLLTLP